MSEKNEEGNNNAQTALAAIGVITECVSHKEKWDSWELRVTGTPPKPVPILRVMSSTPSTTTTSAPPNSKSGLSYSDNIMTLGRSIYKFIG